MAKGLFWIVLAVINVYLAGFLMNAGQATFSLIVALYCGVLSIWYFYAASKGVK